MVKRPIKFNSRFSCRTQDISIQNQKVNSQVCHRSTFPVVDTPGLLCYPLKTMGMSGPILRERYLARRMADQLLRADIIHSKPKPDWLSDKIESLLAAQSQIEMRVDAEAKELLQKYQNEMDRGAVDSHKMFVMIKKKLIRDRNLILQSDPTLSPEDKMNHLAHMVEQGLMRDPDVEKKGDAIQLLQEIKKVLNLEQEQEKEVHDLVRNRLAHGKILEGSEKWDLLYQKTFEEVMKKRGR